MSGSTEPTGRTLVDAVCSFDGVRIEPLERAYRLVAPTAIGCATLVELATEPDPQIQTAATWILARWVASGSALRAPQFRALCEAATPLPAWQARLHLCQAFAVVKPPTAVIGLARRQFRRWTSDHRPFVRAWAYAALARTAEGQRQDATSRRLRATVAMGLEDPAPSVRTRVRKILRAWPAAEAAER